MPQFKSELSKKNKYHISKHRYLELKHFCLQYYEWKQRYKELSPGDLNGSSGLLLYSDRQEWSDPTGNRAAELADLSRWMRLVEDCCHEADSQIWNYIFRGVTEGLSFETLKSFGIPCERDMYYDRYRRFFYILHSQKIQGL